MQQNLTRKREIKFRNNNTNENEPNIKSRVVWSGSVR